MVDPSPSLWVREAEPFTAATRGAPPRTADVVVIGGGVAGASAALALARRGVDVTLLDAGQVAGRASGRNDGQVLLGLGEHYNRIVGQFGAIDARRLWSYIEGNSRQIEAEIATFDIDCGYQRAGGLRLAETEHEHEELCTSQRMLDEEGIEHALIDREALREVMPAAVGFHGALHLPGEAVVQPAALVRGLARGASQLGARVFQDRTVTAIDPDENDSGSIVRCDDGTAISCAMVVHCTSTLARSLDSTGFLAANVFPFRGQILATDPLHESIASGFGPHAMSSNFCYEYFRIHHGRFVIGGMRWSVPGEEQGILDDTTINEQVSTNLRRYVADHFPCLGGVDFPHAWTGIMAGTGDGLPLCGALPGRPGVFALLAFNGYGLSFACAAGVSVAEQIVDGRASHEATEMFAPRRFRA